MAFLSCLCCLFIVRYRSQHSYTNTIHELVRVQCAEKKNLRARLMPTTKWRQVKPVLQAAQLLLSKLVHPVLYTLVRPQMVADCSLKPVYSRSVYWSLWDLPSTYCGLPLSPEGVHAAHLVKHTWAPTSTSKDSPPRRDRQERPSSQLDDSFILFALILREGMCNCV